jgi:hypothetical protein
VSLVLWRWPVSPGARGPNVRFQTEFDAKPSFDPSVEVPHGDLVESLDQIDAPVEVLEPLQLDAVLPLPCRPVRYDRGKRFELPELLTDVWQGPRPDVVVGLDDHERLTCRGPVAQLNGKYAASCASRAFAAATVTTL